MPKLNKKLAEATEKAEGLNTELVDEGIYVVELKSVETKEGKDSKKPYWLWTFEVPEDADEHGGKRFWLNTSLSENALWKLNEVFGAFGVTPDTDTDELVGEKVRLVISQRPIGAGPRMGEVTNQVETVLVLDEDEDGEDGEDSDGEPPF
jgi:hypothetical protein